MLKFKVMIVLVVVSAISLFGAVKVSYNQYNGSELKKENAISFIYKDGVAYLSYSDEKDKYFIDFNSQKTVKLFDTGEKKYKVSIPFSSFPSYEETSVIDTILGHKCKKVIYNIFSNKIEIWYSENLEVKGAPYLRCFPKNSLVMQYIVNGGYKLRIKDIKKDDPIENDVKFKDFYNSALEITDAKYTALKIRSRYTIIPVFDKQQINFDSNLKIVDEEVEDNKIYRFSKGTVILKKIKFPKINKGSQTFVKLTDWSNGDAYDRTGSVFVIPATNKETMLTALRKGVEKLPNFIANNGKKYQGFVRTKNYLPSIELMRFFTPFGVGHFNNKRIIEGYNWQDSVVYKQDISDLISCQNEEVIIGVFIGNYDKGGHKVSLEIDYYPSFEKDKVCEDKWIYPLFNTVNIMEASGQNYSSLFRGDSLKMDFEIPDNIKNIQLIFNTTGHGGWGNGDEFNKRLNQIFIDDKEVFRHIPWRTDCATYRMSNPASGNFGNGLSSSDLSRSNWAPGTATDPFFILLNNLKPGKHRIVVAIDQGKDEGNSFNAWSISGVLVGEKK